MPVFLVPNLFPSMYLPFAQKKRQKEPYELPCAGQFQGMTCMFVPHWLPFAFHPKGRLIFWPHSSFSIYFPLLSIFFHPLFLTNICRWILKRKETLSKGSIISGQLHLSGHEINFFSYSTQSTHDVMLTFCTWQFFILMYLKKYESCLTQETGSSKSYFFLSFMYQFF